LAYLELEFSAPRNASSGGSVNQIEFTKSNIKVASHLSPHVLDEYFESMREVFEAARRKRTPPMMHPGRLRRILRCFRHKEPCQDLLEFPPEYCGSTFNLGFVELNGHEHWIEMTVGVGNSGITLWKRVVSAGGHEIIKGIVIGMLSDSSHMVIVKPGGGVWLVYDF
jgi:hypothetical protein